MNNSWEAFLAEAADVFIAKNTDYDSRFMKALIHYYHMRGYEAARTIWAWEVEKKLDRCRTWILRGELKVKAEGVRNSVIDAFNYTVQYEIFLTSLKTKLNPIHLLTEKNFYTTASSPGAKPNPGQLWLDIWSEEHLIKPTESELRALLLREMTGGNG